jgi:hypothetical protein
MLVLYMNDKRNKLQDPLKKRKRDFLKKNHKVEKKNLFFVLHMIVAKLVDADCFVTSLSSSSQSSPVLVVVPPRCHTL